MNATVESVSPVVVAPANQSAIVPASGVKVTRMTKKDFFATLPSDMHRSARETAFDKYAGEFSAMRAAEISGALAAGLIRVRNVRTASHGKSGTIGYEVVPERKDSEVDTLRARIAELEAKLASA